MPRQTTYNKPVTGLRKNQLIKLAHDLDLPPDGTVSDLRDWIKIHLNAHRDDLIRDPRFKNLITGRRNQPQAQVPVVPGDGSQPNSRVGTPAPSNSPSWGGIHDDVQFQPPIPVRPPSQAPMHTSDNDHGTYNMLS